MTQLRPIAAAQREGEMTQDQELEQQDLVWSNNVILINSERYHKIFATPDTLLHIADLGQIWL